MDIPVKFEDINKAYNDLSLEIQTAFAGQLLVGALDQEKADKWATLLATPDFKPGRSNLEQDAKLRAAYPEFMDGYEKAVIALEHDKLAVELARLEVGRLKSLLDLGKILAVTQDELEE